jgi:hypothetical protein
LDDPPDLAGYVAFKAAGDLGQSAAFGGAAGDVVLGRLVASLARFGNKLTNSCNSFDPGTPVLMADGNTKPIKDVKLGDKVKATEPTNGKTASKTVTQLHDNLDVDLADLTTVDEHGQQAVIHTTQNHPFWDTTSQAWTTAGKLRPGDRLLTPAGSTVKVIQVLPLIKPRYMLNLTIADIHTYYVMAGNTPVLVHNDGGNDGILGRDDLTSEQLGNLARYEKKLPAGAEPTVITRGADGAVQFEAKVSGRVPGSYANYTKTVDPSGNTIGYTKTTIVPDGSVAHVKDKMVGGC